MEILLETEALRCSRVDGGLIWIEDKTGLLFASMVTGPVGSEPGDSVKAMLQLPVGLRTLIDEFDQQIFLWFSRSLPQMGYAPSNAYGGDSTIGLDQYYKVVVPMTAGQSVDVFFVNNEKQHLSGIGCWLREENAMRAESRAYTVLNTIISDITFRLRVPVHVQRTEVLDLSGSSPRYYVTLHRPFQGGTLRFSDDIQSPTILTDNVPWRRALAYYRESLLLPLPTYRFLALYKALEDLVLAKSILYRQARSLGARPVLPPVVVPNSQFFHQHFPELAGRPSTEAQKYLKSEYRHRVAHAVLEDGSYVTSDLREGIVQYSNLCSLADVMFRNTAESLRTAAKWMDNQTTSEVVP